MRLCDTCQDPTPEPIDYGVLKVCEACKLRLRIMKARVKHRLKTRRTQ